ncbi:hypothetical protein [Fulvivirga ligni]|uniref:hypothetical protein n=1 Tax=Fulvivirga ligni TaxID=2904246 RepID=UPI001F1B7CBB|nr:hypothetical protein [Fulvivirga ligni]UII19607.1 hypothetical protein LVD16_17345 [Fulvivirga ligni]
MIKFSPYITIYDLEQDFNGLTEVIWTFSKNLKGISTQNQRFNIHIVSREADQRMWLEGSIKSVWKYFDQSKLNSNSDEENRRAFLELIADSFLLAADDLKWDKLAIERAYAQSLNDGIAFCYSSKPQLNKSKTAKSSLKLKLKENKVQLFVVFTMPDKNVEHEILLIETFQYHIDGLKTFKDPQWLSDDEFGFSFEMGITLSASIESLSAKWNHHNSKMELGFIKSVTYVTFNSENERIEWING